jgi:Kef-type K+ transport system membrane component KefB/mannitol/fructose-specific phosphotransferase system IIA component
MDRLTSAETVVMFLSLGTLLGSARVLGEVAKRLRQPAVLGEILAGVLLGPTVLARISPEVFDFLFPATGSVATAMDGLTVLAITLFLLVAGMEVDLSMIWRQGRVAASVSLTGLIFPFVVGLSAAHFAPSLMGRHPGADPLVFSLFFATALSISALPVIAKTLMDLNLYRTSLGMVVVAAAIFNDLLGWIIFAVVLGLMGTSAHSMPIIHTVWMILAFAAFMLTVGRRAIHWSLPWIQTHLSWPGSVLGFSLTCALLCAAFTEWIGVHAIFGAFIFGVAFGDSSHLREETRSSIDRFVSFIFAPLFFASIGLKVDFADQFDGMLVATVLVISCFGKILGGGLGARLGGMPWRESWAVGFGMNARGAMEIILGLVALHAGIIRERLFVAIVIMAIATSVMSGPVMQLLLRKKKPLRFADILSDHTFINPLQARDRWEAIAELSAIAAETHALDANVIKAAVCMRERIAGTGFENGVAVPHARLPFLERPIVAIGISREGLDFEALDGELVRVVILLLSPANDTQAQLTMLAEIARAFSDPRTVRRTTECSDMNQLIALLNAGRRGHHGSPAHT